MYKKPACVLALLSLVLPATVWALGLGSIETQSALNQPFKAEIPLIAASGQDLSGIQAGLASRQAYQQAGLDYSGELDELSFKVVKTPQGPAIRITSDKPIKEPLLNLLVDVQWSQGQLEREYDVLLNPPTMMSRESHPAPQSATVAPSSGQSAGATSQHRTGHGARHPQHHLPKSYRVGRNETLWGIASKLRPGDSVTVNQMMVALYQRNPRAFRGNMNRLKRGAVLRVPSMPDVAAVGRLDAYREARHQHREWLAARRHAQKQKVAASSGHQAHLELVAPGSARKGGKTSDQAAQEGASGGSGSNGASAGGNSKALAALQSQVQQLQQRVNKLQHMMTVKNNQLAQLQAELKKQQAGTAGAMGAGVSGTASQQASASQAASGGPSGGSSGPGAAPQKTPNGGSGAGKQAGAGGSPGSPGVNGGSTPGKTAQNGAGAASTGASLGKTGNSSNASGTRNASGAGKAPGQAQGQPTGKPAPKHAATAASKRAGPARSTPALKASLMGRIKGFLAVVEQVVRNPLALAAVVGLPLLLGLLVAVRRRRQAAEAGGVLESEDIGRLNIDEDSFSDGVGGGTDSLAITGDTGPVAGSYEDAGTTRVESGSTTSYAAGEEFAAGTEDDHGTDTERGEEVPVEVEDPVSEVDFHLAYGLYDEALGIVAQAIESEPARRDLKLKQLEVLFAAGRAETFLEKARQLAEEPQGTSDSNWDKASIMGRQLFPEEPLFSADGGPGEIEDDFLDIDLPADESTGGEQSGASEEWQQEASVAADDGDGETGISLDDLLPDEADIAAGGSAASLEEPNRGDQPGHLGEKQTNADEARDAGSERGTDTLDARADDALEFELDEERPDGSGADAYPPEDEPARAGNDADALDFDLDELTAQTDDQDDFRWSDETAGTGGSEGGDDDALEFDLSEEWAESADGESQFREEGDAAPEDAGEVETTSERRTDLDLDQPDVDPGEEPGPAVPAATAGDAGQGAGGGIDEDEVATKLDLAEAYLGMEDAEGARALLEEVLGEGTGEQRERARQMLEEAGGGTGAATEVAAEQTPSGARPATPTPGGGGKGDDEPIGYGDDVGTKLDLARAYLGMDDTAAARRMLDEVLEEGDEAQKQEAQSLLDELR